MYNYDRPDVSHNTHTEEICICYTCSYKGTTNKIMRQSHDKDIYIYIYIWVGL